MLTQVHCVSCGKILRIDAEKETALCPKCQEQPKLNQDPQSLSTLAKPPITLSVENAVYRLTTESDTKRNLGSYLSCLYKILASAGIRGNVSEWCQRVGADKFHEGVKHQILVQENDAYDDDLEHRREGYLIRENPPKPNVETPEVQVIKLVRSGNNTLTAEISYKGQSALLRIQRLGGREEWTTDNIDIIDTNLCAYLDDVEKQMHNHHTKPLVADMGPLRYHLRSRCPGI